MDNREDNHKSRVFNWKQTMCSRMALGLRRDGSPVIAEGEREALLTGHSRVIVTMSDELRG